MGTWSCVLVETGGRKDFWQLARDRRAATETGMPEVPPVARLDSDDLGNFEAAFALAESLSAAIGKGAVAFYGQSASDAYELRAYQAGEQVRRLQYVRDDGGWLSLEGAQQPWERAFFFDGHSARADGSEWPDMLSDEIGDEDIERFEAARLAGDASSAMDLLGPHSLAPLHRILAHFGLSGAMPPHATFKGQKKSLLGKLFGG